MRYKSSIKEEIDSTWSWAIVLDGDVVAFGGDYISKDAATSAIAAAWSGLLLIAYDGRPPVQLTITGLYCGKIIASIEGEYVASVQDTGRGAWVIHINLKQMPAIGVYAEVQYSQNGCVNVNLKNEKKGIER